jgi:hypothetical protein
MPRTLAGLVALAGLLALSPLHAEEPWKPHTTKDGLAMERRAVSDSKYFEYRIRTESPAPPKAVLQGMWSGLGEDLPPSVTKRTFLSRAENEVVVYDQIKTPVVSDRDVAIRIRRLVHEDTGVMEVQFETVNQLAPPPDSKYVRIPMVRGGWIIAPNGSGGSTLTYVCYSEPGGSIPAFLVRGAQQDQVFVDVKRILRRALVAK